MKIYIALVCMLLSAGVATAQTAKDFDLTCAVTAGAEIASNPKGSAEREAAMMVWTFYLGRLSGREDKTSWAR